MSLIKNVIHELEQRTPLTIVSHGNIRNPSLRRFLLQKLKVPFGESGSFLAEPFIEGMFPWSLSGTSRTELVTSGRLHPKAEKAIRNTLPDDADYLRLHQLEALDAVAKGKSIVVTTGTGSGKTECFLYPIIEALCRDLDSAPAGPLQGVRALFLYPLNALIESQRKRFLQICEGTGGRVRFAMFNGNTLSKGTSEAGSSELLYKWEIRAQGEGQTPPNLLVTNSTMLELALVRREDQQIFEKSKGTLKFVVLDEAHTYVGSDAAELAMRLRRTLHAFGVDPKDVRFIATSATTGDDTGRLQEFLARISGVRKEDVQVIGGQRSLPSIMTKGGGVSVRQILESDPSDPVALHGMLTRCEPAMALRKTLHESGRLSLGDVAKLLKLEKTTALEFLDRASLAVSAPGSTTFFLPFKSHLFQRSFQGAWACWNPECSYKDKALLGDDWKFGQIHLDPPRRIPDASGVVPANWDKCTCGSSLFEVLTCNHCGEPLLGAQENGLELSLPGLTEEDLEESSEEPEDDEPDDGLDSDQSAYRPVLVAASDSEKSRPMTNAWLQTGDSGQPKERSRGIFYSNDPQKHPVRCPGCEHPIFLKKSVPKRSSFPLRDTNLSSPRVSSKSLYHGLAKSILRSDEPTDSSLPQKGRRMLGFTDSRQGTAYHAASQGLQSEINATRVWILDALLKQLNQTMSFDDFSYREIELEARESGDDPEALRADVRFMRGLQKRFDKNVSASGLGFEEMEGRIASKLRSVLMSLGCTEGELAKRLHLPDGLQKEHVNGETVAQLLLWRELSFRTRRKKNLETLGLLRVEYGLESKIQRGLDAFAGDLPKTHNFLKILLDYGFRAQGSLASGWHVDDIKACYGTRAIPKPFDDENSGRYGVAASEPSKKRWIEVLAYELLRAERGAPVEWSVVRDLMAQSIELLRGDYLDSNLKLKLSPIRLVLPERIWLCPVTKTLLDEAVGIGATRFSPYSVSQIQRHPEKIRDEGIVVPRTRDGISAWGAVSPEWWTDLHREVLEVDPDDAYVVAQEHSAQLNREALKDHQVDFADGKINLLNCSTTMEMGVDIGSISIVAMTNVPPYSHNYLQRAGRAGRGSQGQSLVWTLCGAGAHDRLAWEGALEWVKKAAYRPHVSLDSSRIVQRHLHAWLLGAWMKEFGRGIKTPAQWFLGRRLLGVRAQLDGSQNPDDRASIVLNAVWKLMTDLEVEQIQWLDDEKQVESVLRQSTSDSLSEDFRDWLVTESLDIPTSLVAGTSLQGVAYRQIALEAADSIRNARSRWIEDVERICTVLCSLENPSARWRLVFELKRLGDNPLVTYLAEKGALPMNSLPSEVVQLSLNQKPPEKKGRSTKPDPSDQTGIQKDGRKKVYTNLPSRERPVAIREYAPGCGVIIDGKVHTVRYVVRNWKLLPGADPDPQTLRTVKLCHECGAARVSTAQMGGGENFCPECNASLTSHFSRKLLIPSGFIADRRVTRSFDDVQRSSYEIPRIGMHQKSVRRPIQQGGEMRAGRATVVFLNGGGWETPKDTTKQESPKLQQSSPFGPGAVVNALSEGKEAPAPKTQDDHFHVCMECGFTVPLYAANSTSSTDASANPFGLADHKKWDKAKNAFVACPGASAKVGDPTHQVVSLGALQETDAFALQLPILKGEGSRKAALTWALALRNVLAKSLDVRKEELGWTARKGTNGWSMLVFDRAPGGADFAPKAMERLPKLFREARELMEGCHCETVCHKCLLDREVQGQWNDLDRKAALKEIPASFVDQLGLPEHLQYWGSSSRACLHPLGAEIRSAMGEGSGELRIFLHGKPGDWDFEHWTLADSLRDWKRGEGNRLRVFVTAEAAGKAHDHCFLFTELVTLVGQELEVVHELPRLEFAGNSHCIAAEFVRGGLSTQWIRSSADGKPSTEPVIGSSWGEVEQSVVTLRGEGTVRPIVGVGRLTLKDIFPQNALIWDIPSKNDCKISGFAGSVFARQEFLDLWGVLRDQKPVRLVYSDIYLRNPLAFALLYRLVEFFDPEALVIRNSDRNLDKEGCGWERDYANTDKSDAVLKSLFSDRRVSIEHPYLPHERILTLEYDNGCVLSIHIGKGLGYWKTKSRSALVGTPNAGGSAVSDASMIRRGDFEVETTETAHLYARKVANV